MEKGTPALWVYKCNALNREYQISAGDWDDFFSAPQPCAWGGSHTIGNRSSLAILWDKMDVGDLVLAWQSDRKLAVGLCVVHELVDEFDADGNDQRKIILNLVDEPFSPPVPLLKLRRENSALARVKAFRPGYPATLYETSPTEARQLLRICGVSTSDLAAGSADRPKPGMRKGSGFGTAAQNKKVEIAAVNAVKHKYRSWSLVDRQKHNVGFDYQASKGGETRNLEIKGVSGSMPSFPITENEVNTAKRDANWRLRVVTEALGPQPRVLEWTAEEFLRDFDLRPIVTHMARLRP